MQRRRQNIDRQNYEEFIRRNEELSEIPCIETLVTYLYLGQDWPWGILCRLANLRNQSEATADRTRFFNPVWFTCGLVGWYTCAEYNRGEYQIRITTVC